MQVLTYRNLPFESLEKIQQECQCKVSEDSTYSFLIVCEPLPTFTSGISAKKEDLLWDTSTLQEKGIAIETVSRGGKWTYHGPGQIVLYPILQLEQIGLSSRDTKTYVQRMAEAVQSFLSIHGLTSCIRETPYGVYIGEKKICSFGVRVEKGITSHGLALYLSPQTSAFQGIHPCGQEKAEITSLWEEGIKLTWLDASNQLVESIKKSFKLT